MLAVGANALAAGRWEEARAAFDEALTGAETAEGCFGLAVASWWLCDNDVSVAQYTRAYTLFRQAGDVERAVHCAVRLVLTYKANLGNFAAANGWIERADRLLGSLGRSSVHGWAAVARAYRMPNLAAARELAQAAVDIAHDTGDVDLELAALAQLGMIRVGMGDTTRGFALIDEAMAAVLAGERTSLDTVVYTCCNMLNACELASDLDRAARWCQVADDFVATYGSPFLYAECRIFYGSVLTAKGRWVEADREFAAGLHITAGVCPGLHGKALTSLARLRIRQGHLEEAGQLLYALDAEAEVALSLAALRLAKGDAVGASRSLEQRLDLPGEGRLGLAAALDLLVEAHAEMRDVRAASAAAARLAAVVEGSANEQLAAMLATAKGRTASLGADPVASLAHFERALTIWLRLELPFEAARTRFALAQAVSTSHPDIAVDHAQRALASFEDLGAGLDADRVAAFLRSSGFTPRVGPKGVGVLTAREQEVLQLVGRGLSNPEIAERLHVSRKTASHHVSSILSKLGLRNRAEAAGYAVGVIGVPAAPTVHTARATGRD